MNNSASAITTGLSGTLCGCIGPQDGQPVCPCQMRHVSIINGRYVRTQDLGPAPNGGLPDWATRSPLADLAREGARIKDKLTGHDLGRAD